MHSAPCTKTSHRMLVPAQMAAISSLESSRASTTWAKPISSSRRAPGQVVDGHLGAGVQRQGGVPLPDDPGQAQILHQHAIHPGGGYRIQGMEPLGQLPVGHQCVQRYIDPYPAGMAPANGLRQGVFVKVFGARARIKAAQPK